MRITAAVSFALAFITTQNVQRPWQNLVQNPSLFSILISPLVRLYTFFFLLPQQNSLELCKHALDLAL